MGLAVTPVVADDRFVRREQSLIQDVDDPDENTTAATTATTPVTHPTGWIIRMEAAGTFENCVASRSTDDLAVCKECHGQGCMPCSCTRKKTGGRETPCCFPMVIPDSG